MAFKTCIALVALLAVASALPQWSGCGCHRPKPTCGCQPRPQPCHQKIQVPITTYVNEEIDVPVEVCENIPVAQEDAEYEKEEKEFRADAHAYEEGHSHYQRWEDADANNRHTQERGCSHAEASVIPFKRCEHQKVDIQVPVEEIVEIDVEIPQPVVKPCGCHRCAQNLPSYQQMALPMSLHRPLAIPAPPMVRNPYQKPCGCSLPKPCGCNKYFF